MVVLPFSRRSSISVFSFRLAACCTTGAATVMSGCFYVFDLRVPERLFMLISC